MTVAELIRKLADVPQDWAVEGTRNRSLMIWDCDGDRYGYVFTDSRETKLLRQRPRPHADPPAGVLAPAPDAGLA